MDWNFIYSRNENLNEVYRSFSVDLERYIKEMENYVEAIDGSVSSLAGAWSGPEYDAFKASMHKATDEIKRSLERGTELTAQMKEAQRRLADGLARMRARYGG